MITVFHIFIRQHTVKPDKPIPKTSRSLRSTELVVASMYAPLSDLSGSESVANNVPACIDSVDFTQHKKKEEI